MLQGGSTFYLMPHTHVKIISNHAKRGGGIYIDDGNSRIFGPCFFQLLDLRYPYSDIDSVVTLENNTADEAGSALYGGEIDNCYIQATSQRFMHSIVFAIVFKILDLPSLVSQVSSNPFAVSLCNRSDSSANAGSEIHRIQIQTPHTYPGQMLKVPVTLYGQRNGSVPGIVYAHFLESTQDAHLAPLQETQQIGYLCQNVTYTIFSTRQYELILLSVDGDHFYANELPVLIGVTLLPCPSGFQLSNITAQCECVPILQDRGLLCNISGATPLVQRTRSTWISTHHNGCDVILHDHCPLNYCRPTQLWLHLGHPDEQCAHGRSGIL